jgi:lipopolysaccharide exporter
MAKTLTASALEASKWNSVGFLSRGAASIVVGIVLARLLGPKPFGQVGVATIIYSFGNLLADAGFSSAVVQRPELKDRQIQFAFTMQILFGLVLTAVVFSIAPLVGTTVHDPAVTNVVRAVSPIFLLQSLGQTATGLLKRTMGFRVIQTAQIFSYLLGYAVVGIGLAYAGLGVWSLVAAQLCQPLLYSVLVYFQVRHSASRALGFPAAQIRGSDNRS